MFAMYPIQCNLLYINRLQIGTTASSTQDASARWACRPGGPDYDTNCILPWMQMDQDGPFASAGCVGSLKMPTDNPANEADEKELA
jgi:hypothetical protein